MTKAKKIETVEVTPEELAQETFDMIADANIVAMEFFGKKTEEGALGFFELANLLECSVSDIGEDVLEDLAHACEAAVKIFGDNVSEKTKFTMFFEAYFGLDDEDAN